MKTNYYDKSLALFAKIKKENKPVSILIHACCAPCACFPLSLFDELFDVTIIYNNSNIYPLSEYEIRLNELKKYINRLNLTRTNQIKLVESTYDNISYNTFLAPNRSSCREGQAACIKCYEKRMSEGYEYASEHHFDYYATVMSISRQKNAQAINEIGANLEKLNPCTKFFYADFKKKGGQEKRDLLSKDMYKQKYCGCIYSYQESLIREQNKIKAK